MTKKVLVVTEVKDQELRQVSFEALAVGQKIADGGEVVGVLLGESIDSLTDSLFHYGADRVVTVNEANLKNFTTDAYQQAVLQVIDKEQPEAIILGHTSIGKDISPRIAMKLEAGLVSDVTAVEEVDGEIVFTRPIYSGKAFEKKKINDGIVMATIRPNNIAALQIDTSKSGEVTPVNVDIKDLRTTIKDIVRKTTEGVDLSEAKVIVAGGRGVKNSEGFEPLKELAQVLNGAVGASRGACDAEYCDYSLQIGQTGKVVTPDLYIACGISGAIQHVAGMSNSKIIVAINKDSEAPIFDIADYGIVGDLFDIVPLLTDELKKVLNVSEKV
ncbi:electron transfer flavoprotein subunit alpha/FixB family protein [Alkalihalobacillus pseudalcaliphilus]|uniref:electron transfer flavoprotein subunit alpha/FixB family protein n=1 Tax=Alkalihalobacillus pseudalcaliphilus TaxID=79884 RepID=UPI00064DA5EB|nr:electron transfer flavoprotein subunit alpha/FixB family protein [Alkalihalobacillus pseudalcaliphilus]KMK77749.1 electron transfer flavoprotein subunit alpha [Alkalihalobacillus pseudalcaliphilus]